MTRPIHFCSLLIASFALLACGGGGGGGGGECNANGAPVNISGRVSYDLVPDESTGITARLNYDEISREAVRGATVSAVNRSGNVVASTSTDDNGDYALSVPGDTEVAVQVAAELAKSGAPSWQVRVVDNTRGDAPYVLRGQSLCSGSGDSRRDLHAPSGWSGSGYGSERAAGPFAILDSVYQAIVLLAEIDPNLNLPALEINWSSRNRAVAGSLSDGDISTSFFDGIDQIFILGDEDNDTDEYDRSVIQHELVHFLEAQISRSDSLGGPHGRGDRLDPRVALSEGLGNALSGAFGGRSVYIDSIGPRQSAGFTLDLEDDAPENPGWFSEASVQRVVFDVFDSANESHDAVNGGLATIYRAMISDQYRLSPAQTMIYSFAEAMKSQLPADEAEAVDELLSDEQIFGRGDFGEAETNDGGLPGILPVYRPITPGQRVNVCMEDRTPNFNSVDRWRFMALDIAQSGNYRLSITRTSGPSNRDPEAFITRGGEPPRQFLSSVADSETGTTDLNTGLYTLILFDDRLVGANGINTIGRICFDVIITAS